MAHEITSTDHMFSASRVTPWHGLGTVVDTAPTSAEALKLAKLNWSVLQAPVQYEGAKFEKIRTVKDRFVNYRSDNGQPVGLVGKNYNIIQNTEAFEFTDALLGEGVKYETAGSLQGGSKIWLLASTPKEKVLGDIVVPYLLFFNGHDGTSKVRACITPVRVVCQNTLNIALRDTQRSWAFTHSQHIKTKLQEATQTLQLANNYMSSLKEQSEILAKEKITKQELRDFVEKMFPLDDAKTPNGVTRTKDKIERFRECFHAEDVSEFRGTKWGLILAMSDFTTHVPLRNEKHKERFFEKSVLDGSELLDATFSKLS